MAASEQSDYSASQISVISGKQLMESVRKRPGMYVGGTDASGVQHLVTELISNSIDQFLAGHASELSIKFLDNVIEIDDDGPGLPPYLDGSDSIEKWFLNYHTTATAAGHAPHVHLTLLGAGLVSVAALSDRLQVESITGGKCTRMLFAKGELIEKNRLEKPPMLRGCRYQMTVERSIMDVSMPNRSALRGLMFQAAHLFPGLKINFDGELFHSSNGLGDLIYLLSHPTTHQLWPRPELFAINGRQEDVQFSVAAVGEAVDRSTAWMSWANGVATASHGDHVNGFEDALKEAGWEPAIAMIHVVMHEPNYAGPVKDRLLVPKIRSVMKKKLLREILAYLDAHPQRG